MQRIPRLGFAFGMMCFLLMSTPLVAQTVHSKQIYLWDVTWSMIDNDIWETVKENFDSNVGLLVDMKKSNSRMLD